MLQLAISDVLATMELRKKIGIRDVAKAAGVSVATVSRVLAKADYPVTEETRKRVTDVATAMGYVPNLLAKTFATSRTDTIGVAMPVLNAYYAKMLAGIEGAATEAGLSILLTIVGASDERRESAIDQFVARQLDGVIICSGAKDGPLRRAPEQMGVPAVIIGQQPSEGYVTVTVDNRRASYEATDHLVSRGNRTIVFLTSNSDWPDFRDRLYGFQQRLAEEDRVTGQVIEGVYDEAQAYRAVTKLVAEKTTATAILAATDRQALGAMAALADAGLRVPSDMAVVGFDNYHTSEFVRPSLTSVDMPADAMGAKAVELVCMAKTSGAEKMASVVLEPRLFIRQSSGSFDNAALLAQSVKSLPSA
ncbi:LacI family DNA-binding transcriptional regulator [Devosia sp. MC521]|uniref:LacI family DNA-binding transcriptional regulator n=1 Tax=Devosia sp. MC521 TaxID=2759954 RepID=UPI0015FA30BF|nr:LacI family DNA-binding transcriptional regulator [Devosia sp. MC521]MBJ6988080.1 LacI family DNA-binding transcriptional regulator [Devosia sp. MC521]QMW63369.1 LacI family DNA-binding transcriptional regulator [Devosia sp. MC521]